MKHTSKLIAHMRRITGTKLSAEEWQELAEVIMQYGDAKYDAGYTDRKNDTLCMLECPVMHGYGGVRLGG
jgi:hypothetical protein